MQPGKIFAPISAPPSLRTTMSNPRLLLALLLAVMGAAAGCGESPSAPPPQATIPRNDPPAKIPTTKEEKVAAINRAPIPEEQKKREIAKVMAGP